MVALSKHGKLKPAIDNVVTSVFSLEGDCSLHGAEDTTKAIRERFGLSLDETLVRSSIDRCVSQGKLRRDQSSKSLCLPTKVRAEIQDRAERALELEQRVCEEWIGSVRQGFQEHPVGWEDELWNCLQAYMVKAFRRHGIETTQLLDPRLPVDEDDSKNLRTYFEEAAREHLTVVESDEALWAIQSFFGSSTSRRTRYITQLLDGTFTFFALTVDKATSEYLRGNMAPLDLFLDTNFVFDILGLHSNPLTDASQELVEVIKQNEFPFKLYYHEKTLAELERTLQALGSPLRGRTWRPALSRVAVGQPQLNDIERLYHTKNAESPLNVDAFLSRFENVPELLKQHNFVIYRAPGRKDTNDQERYEMVGDYKEFVESGPRPKVRSYQALDHDMTVRLTVARQRKADSSALDAGAFFLTTDFTLYKFDLRRMQKRRQMGLVVLPNQVLQLLRPFVESTDDFDRRFIEAFAVPEFRSMESDYSSTQSQVLSYLSTYSDSTLSEETASRILANDLLIEQLKEVPEDSEEFATYIEGAVTKDNELLLNENRRLRDEVETIKREAGVEHAQIVDRLQEQERANTEVNSALVTAESRADRAEQQRSEANQRIDELQETASDLNRNMDRIWLILRITVAAARSHRDPRIVAYHRRSNIALVMVERSPVQDGTVSICGSAFGFRGLGDHRQEEMALHLCRHSFDRCGRGHSDY